MAPGTQPLSLSMPSLRLLQGWRPGLLHLRPAAGNDWAMEMGACQALPASATSRLVGTARVGVLLELTEGGGGPPFSHLPFACDVYLTRGAKVS